MGLDIYWIGLLVLVPVVVIIAGHETIMSLVARGTSTEKKKQQQQKEEREIDPLDDEAAKFQRTFLRVYLLVIGSEWLQVGLYPGPRRRIAGQPESRRARK